MHMSISALPPETVATVRRVDGVAWAEAIRYTTTFLVAGDDRQQLSYVIGYDPATGRGGPRRLTSGRGPAAGEIVVEEIAADRLGVGIGGTVGVFGDAFRISGLFRGGTTIANSIAFIGTDDFAGRAGPAIAYVLAGALPGVGSEDLARRVAAAVPGDTVQTRDRPDAGLDRGEPLGSTPALVATSSTVMAALWRIERSCSPAWAGSDGTSQGYARRLHHGRSTTWTANQGAASRSMAR